MDTNLFTALIGAAATIAAAVITARYQMRQSNGLPTAPAGGPPPTAPGTPPAATQPPSSAPPPSTGAEAEVEDDLPQLDAGEEAPPPAAAGQTAAPVPVPCPRCRKRYLIRPGLWFKKLRCKKCDSRFRANPITGGELVK